jgi:hypothetical protein
MSTPAAELAFCQALANAESARQSAKGSAAATYGFIKANYPAYLTALVAADAAYFNAVVAAATAGGLDPALGVGAPVASAWWAKVGGY